MVKSSSSAVPVPGVTRLANEPGKDHWSVRDVFRPVPQPVCAFVHRNYHIGMHTHDFIEVNVVLAGRGRHYMQEHAFETAAGDVFVIPPEVSHGYEQEEALDVFHLLLHPLFVQRHGLTLQGLPGFMLLFTVEPYVRRETGFRYGLHLEGEAFRTVAELQGLLAGEAGRDGADRDVAVESLTLYLLTFLCRCYAAERPVAAAEEPPEQHPHWRVVQAVMELVARRFQERLMLADLAQAAHLQRNHFCRVFHAATGLTPMDYLQQHRIQVARRLLRETDLSVTAIGLQTGFCDTAHFSRQFSRLVGISPARYRRH